jgi:uncharacterized protein (DUF427 family)
MRVRFGGKWIADSEHVLLLFEPGRYPMAYFPETDVSSDTLQRTEYTTRHPDLGPTCWYAVRAGDKSAPRGAWQHIELPTYASELRGRVAFAWPAMDAFYEEDERIVGHAADSYHRIDIRQASRNLVVRHQYRVVADTKRGALYFCRRVTSATRNLYLSEFHTDDFARHDDLHPSVPLPTLVRAVVSYGLSLAKSDSRERAHPQPSLAARASPAPCRRAAWTAACSQPRKCVSKSPGSRAESISFARGFHTS